MPEHMFGASDHADSAGHPWAGRSFEPNAHASDDGSAPEALRLAVESFHAGDGDYLAIVEAIRESRLLIPLVAEAGDIGFTDEGLKVDKTQELSIVTVATPDGRTALPLFSSVEAMRTWNPEARPVPADGIRAALAAAGEGTPVIVLDAGSSSQVVLRRPAIWAIAKSEPFVPAHLDERIAATIAVSADVEPAVHAIALRNGDPHADLSGPDLEIELTLDPGLDQEQLNALLQRVVTSWQDDPYFTEHVDQLALKVVPAEA